MATFTPKRPATKDTGIRLNEDGTYFVDVHLSKPGGKRWRKKATRVRTKAEARKIRDDFFEAFNFEVYKIESANAKEIKISTSLHAWINKCVKEIWPKKNPQAMRGYRSSALNYIIPYMADQQLSQITPTNCTDFIDRLAKEKPELSIASLKAAYAALGSAMKHAVNAHHLLASPTRLASPEWSLHKRERMIRGIVPKKRVLLSPAQIKEILNSCEDSIYYPVLLLQAKLGTRLGETLALTRDDFDLDRMEVTIDKQLKRIEDPTTGKTKLGIVPPKTQAGNRTIRVSNALLDVIKNADGIICKSKYGGYLDMDNVSFRMSKMVRDLGFKSFNSHTLRHSFISYLVNEKRVPVETVSNIVGHATIQVTLSFYVHSSNQQLIDAMESLDEN